MGDSQAWEPEVGEITDLGTRGLGTRGLATRGQAQYQVSVCVEYYVYLCVRVFGVCACHVHVCMEEVCVEEGVWRRVCVKGVCTCVCMWYCSVMRTVSLTKAICVLKLWQGRFVRCVDSKQ